MKKLYLGDGVYIEAKYGGLQLTTENGISVTNSIFLEPEVYAALLEYVSRLKQRERVTGSGLEDLT